MVGCRKGFKEDNQREGLEVIYPYKRCGDKSQYGLFICGECVISQEGETNGN